MKNRLAVLSVVGVLALAPTVAMAQTDGTETTPEEPAVKTKTAKGTTVSYKGGKLRVKTGKSTVVYLIDKQTGCGWGTGAMGSEMPCSSLKQKKYLAQPVRVTWYADAKKQRVATIVAIDLSKAKKK
jgi:hypothetical protein